MTTLTLSRSLRNNLCNSFAQRLCTQGNITVKIEIDWADIAQTSAWIYFWMRTGAHQHRLTCFYSPQAGDGTQKAGPLPWDNSGRLGRQQRRKQTMQQSITMMFSGGMQMIPLLPGTRLDGGLCRELSKPPGPHQQARHPLFVRHNANCPRPPKSRCTANNKAPQVT
jgi:hypothetical protein